jgi:CheY-like chemotaxis protein
MKEVAVDWLKGEIHRLGAVVTGTRLFHSSGVRLHGPGEPLTKAHLQLLQELEVKSLFLLEPGETEAAAAAGLRSGATDVLLGTAERYLENAPAHATRAKRPDTRLAQATAAREAKLRHPFQAQARVLVAVRDEFQRTILLNTLSAEGHEVSEVEAAKAAAAAREGKADLLIADLADAGAAAAEIRKSYPLFGTVVLAAAPEGKGAEAFKALGAGANGTVALPPRRDPLLESLRAAMAALGKTARMAPWVLADRRKAPRENGNFTCKMTDRFLSKPLPVSDVLVLDVTEEGMRVEYTRPAWPTSWAYIGHSVHPKHYWYNYSRLNALGRDVTVVLSSQGKAPLEAQATVAWVAPAGPLERIGLSLHRARDSVRQHITTIRGLPPGGAPKA